MSTDSEVLKTIALCLVALSLGIVRTIPLAIIFPESLSLGLSRREALVIMSMSSVAVPLVLLVQPKLNKLPGSMYLVLSGSFCCLGYISFYFLVTLSPLWYLGLACVARFTSGIGLPLLNNKTAVCLTLHLHGHIDRASTLWEVFNSTGMAAGNLGNTVAILLP